MCKKWKQFMACDAGNAVDLAESRTAVVFGLRAIGNVFYYQSPLHSKSSYKTYMHKQGYSEELSALPLFWDRKHNNSWVCIDCWSTFVLVGKGNIKTINGPNGLKSNRILYILSDYFAIYIYINVKM